MIDLHTHTILSDGELLPSELVRRAMARGYRAIAVTDHVDHSNIDFVVPRVTQVCNTLNKYWRIKAIPGAEITHVPVETIKTLVRSARRMGAKIVVVHGETLSEPVAKGTNRAAIEAGADILAHPGRISREDALLAKECGVCLEITTRGNHVATNPHLVEIARETGAPLILNTDAHSPEDMVDNGFAENHLKSLGLNNIEINNIFDNSRRLAGLSKR